MESVSFVTIFSAIPFDLIMWSLFGIAALIFGLFSAVLFWHWRVYSTGKFTTIGNLLVFLCVGAGFLVIMLLSTFWYSYTL